MEYEEISQKYGLDVKALDIDFEIGKIEEKPVLFIRKKISERLEAYGNVLEELIQPDSSFSSFYEVSVFDENDKRIVLENFKRIMILIKESMILSLKYDEKAELDFIKRASSEWNMIRENIKPVLLKLRHAWGNDSKDRMIQEYFG